MYGSITYMWEYDKDQLNVGKYVWILWKYILYTPKHIFR